MIFNTPSFLLVFSVFLLCYAWLRETWRLPALITFSLLWYSSWSLPWLILLLAISAIDYWGSRDSVVKKFGADSVYCFLIGFNLAWLLIFRSTSQVLDFFSVDHSADLYKVGTPFGINFYIFLAISYLVDRWRGSRERDNFAEFLAYVSFFPLVTAGPMERFPRLLPQFRSLGPITRNTVADGLVIFAWGFFKKMAIADSLRHPVRAIFLSPDVGLGTALLGGLLSTFHVYADFSAYCDMGRGLARCINVRLGINFRPFYYADSPTDFWRRWNITLGTWIRDYMTLPAMMHWGKRLNLYLILFASFFVMGLWHGLYWNWCLFGALNGCLVVIFTAAERNFGSGLAVKLLGRLLACLLFVCNGLLSQATDQTRLAEVGRNLLFANRWGNPLTIREILVFALPLLVPLLLMDFWQERRREIDVYLGLPASGKLVFTLLCFGLGIMLTRTEMNPFLYFNL